MILDSDGETRRVRAKLRACGPPRRTGARCELTNMRTRRVNLYPQLLRHQAVACSKMPSRRFSAARGDYYSYKRWDKSISGKCEESEESTPSSLRSSRRRLCVRIAPVRVCVSGRAAPRVWLPCLGSVNRSSSGRKVAAYHCRSIHRYHWLPHLVYLPHRHVCCSKFSLAREGPFGGHHCPKGEDEGQGREESGRA